MSLTLSVTQKVELQLQPVDIKGNPAPVDGVPVWDVSDPNLVDLVPSVDGLSAVVAAKGDLGHVQISVRADARLGPDVREIMGVLEIDLVPAEAVALGIVAGPPTEIDEPTIESPAGE
jgi:hypothetical protein